jgi:hypothetical protein
VAEEESYPIDFDVLGRTGLKRSAGHIHEEWHPRLRGLLAVRTYREMSDNDPVIGAFLYAIEALIRQVDWQVDPSGDTDEHKAAAEFVQSAVDDMSITWQDLLSEIMTFLIYGWSYFEILYKRRLGRSDDPTRDSKHNDGKIGWWKLSIRGQESLQRWEINDEGGIMGMWQLAPPHFKITFIPIEKAVLFRTKSNKNNPEGRSVLRNAYRSWFMLKRLQEHEAIGVARNLSGMARLQVPFRIMLKTANANEKQLRTDLENLMQRIHRDEREGLILPSELDSEGKPTGFKFDLLSASGRPINTNEIINRYEQRIAMSTMSEFLLLGMQKVGSLALASTKTELFGVALGAFMDTIAETFTRFPIRDLCRFNNIPEEFWPIMTHGDIEKPELQELAGYIGTLTGAGLNFTDNETETQLREYAGLPVPTNDVPMTPQLVPTEDEDENDDLEPEETPDSGTEESGQEGAA